MQKIKSKALSSPPPFVQFFQNSLIYLFPIVNVVFETIPFYFFSKIKFEFLLMVVRAREGSVSRGKVCYICVFLLLSSFLVSWSWLHVMFLWWSPHWPDALVCSLRFAATASVRVGRASQRVKHVRSFPPASVDSSMRTKDSYSYTGNTFSCSSSCCTVGLALESVSECKDGLSAVSKL